MVSHNPSDQRGIASSDVAMEIFARITARGKDNLFQACAILFVLGVTISSPAMSTPCPADVTTLSVSSTAEAVELSEALLCSGSGKFEVEWSGEVLVTKTMSVSNSTSLKIIGSGSTSPPQAVINGGDEVRLFVVQGGSSLELNNLSIQPGMAWPGIGEAVLVMDSSQLTVVDCSFSYSEAWSSGGETHLCACILGNRDAHTRCLRGNQNQSRPLSPLSELRHLR